MRRRSSNPWFSFESDNDEIDLDGDVTGTVTELDETAIDDAGEDSETVDVVPDVKETSHNEIASAGGIATGNNVDQLEMDPVAATEAYIYRTFGLSREDMEEAVDEIQAKAETLPSADELNSSGDPEIDEAIVDDDAAVAEEESGGEVIDPDELGTDDPALDDDTTIVQPVVDTGDVAMERWFRSLENDDGCIDDDCDSSAEEDDESSEFWR